LHAPADAHERRPIGALLKRMTGASILGRGEQNVRGVTMGERLHVRISSHDIPEGQTCRRSHLTLV
jgi:hypothetical protein